MISSGNKEGQSEDASGGFTGIGSTGPEAKVSTHHLEEVGNTKSISGTGAGRFWIRSSRTGKNPG